MESIARFLDSKQCHPMTSLSTNLLCNNVASPDEFPRYSAFAAVHTKKSEKSETQTAGAVISIGDPPAITVEATSSAKRKLVEIVEPAAESSIIAKRCKNNNDNETEQFSMRIPPSAKSELCQQRAKEQLVFQRKENKQKKLFE